MVGNEGFDEIIRTEWGLGSGKDLPIWRDRGFGMAAVKPFYLDVRLGVRLGALLVFMGASVTLLDVLFSGCIASGPCQPVPPFPIIIPLVDFAIGVAFVLVNVWRAKIR